jgi:hypothetical protein
MVGKTNQLLHGKLNILIYDIREIMQLGTLGLFLLKILVVELPMEMSYCLMWMFF